MADKPKLFSFPADEEIQGKLLDLANANHRSMAGHLRFMIERDWSEEIATAPVRVSYSPTPTQPTQAA